MKSFKKVLLALVAVICSVGFVACSSDDDDNAPETNLTAAQLIGTVWKGTNPDNHYAYQITIKDNAKCEFKITSPDGKPYETVDLPYTYDEGTATFVSQYRNETITGKISGSTMTFTTQGVKVTLKKQ